jgi:DNA-binding NarL/FixJ family response regulator
MLEDALRSYGELGADRDIARICRIMRSNGVPVLYPWRGGRPSHGQVLSSREREVALRAADGKTNQEIAGELFLSRRTVESRVASVLRKLGCRSRKELRAMMPLPVGDG